MKKALGPSIAAACLLMLLAGCGRHDADAPQPAAAPPAAPDTSALGAGPQATNCGARAQEALQRINAARAAGRRCGARYMAPAAALEWDEQLYSAAFGHSADMAQRNYFEHRSPAGTSVRDRVSAAHYKWRGLGENIAAGNRSIAEAVQAWLDSPEHCENLMDPKFVDVAVACVAQPASEWGTYWTMVLGRK